MLLLNMDVLGLSYKVKDNQVLEATCSAAVWNTIFWI